MRKYSSLNSIITKIIHLRELYSQPFKKPHSNDQQKTITIKYIRSIGLVIKKNHIQRRDFKIQK